MGLCGSTDAQTHAEQVAKEAGKQKSREVDRRIAVVQSQESQINKLLLLGAGESGKSTLFKQMITIYGRGFGEAERKNFISIIFNNIILSLKTLVEQSLLHGETGKAPNPIYRYSASLQPSAEYILEAKEDDTVDPTLAEHMKKLWTDKGVQAVYEIRAKFQLNDSCLYYMERLEEISKPGYIPSEQDVLRSRVATTGIVENSFEIDGNSFKMFDVGGQRSERKKWIHCFENVTAVLFVASINAYDQVLYEDETTNRMVEAMTLFEEICNSEWFEKTAMILFLNKKDLFREKIKKVPLNRYFPEYPGGEDYDAATEYIQERFEDKNHQDKEVYTHITCATDTNNIYAVFNYVKDIIIKKGLSRAGLV